MVDQAHPIEQNVSAFNADSSRHGGYLYTAIDRWSSRYATQRQTAGLLDMLTGHFTPAIRLLDIGCGDGCLTLDLFRAFGPASIRAVDPASKAIETAQQRLPAALRPRISFEVGSIYDIKSEGEDVVVLRGVLHHLDRPQDAIAHLAASFRSILVLEPNGFNPAMKLIEKLSPYHRQHDEKSYFPPSLNGWFEKHRFKVVVQRYFCLVPYFCPTPLAKILAAAERWVEPLPVARQIACGTNLILYRRED